MNTTYKAKAGARSPTDIDRIVGENVRRFRITRKRTLADMAASLQVSHQQLQKYETGSNRISAGMLARIASVLGVPIITFFRPDAEIPADQALALRLQALREEGHWVLEAVSEEEDLKRMVAVLRAISESR